MGRLNSKLGTLGMIGAFFLCLALWSCSTTWAKPWNENGIVLGVIQIKKTDYGLEYRYVNSSNNKLLRLEKRNKEGQLLSGASVVTYENDDYGVVAEKYYNLRMEPIINENGYAIMRFRHDGKYPNGEHTYFDEYAKPIMLPEGYHKEKKEFDDELRIKNRLFYDLDGEPVSTKVFNVPGTSRIEYTYLQGVGTVIYAVFYDVHGKMINKRIVSGRISTY